MISKIGIFKTMSTVNLNLLLGVSEDINEVIKRRNFLMNVNNNNEEEGK